MLHRSLPILSTAAVDPYGEAMLKLLGNIIFFGELEGTPGQGASSKTPTNCNVLDSVYRLSSASSSYISIVGNPSSKGPRVASSSCIYGVEL